MSNHGTGRAIAHGVTAAVLAAGLTTSPVQAAGVDISKWSPDYVRSIAGTEEFDTVAHCNSVTPTDYKGKLTFWYQGIFEADPQIMRDNYRDFFAAFRATVGSADTGASVFPGVTAPGQEVPLAQLA